VSAITTPDPASLLPGSGATPGAAAADATSTGAGHPALVTALGPATPTPAPDATGTDAAHPALITAVGRG
jgi:hypothetical protein